MPEEWRPLSDRLRDLLLQEMVRRKLSVPAIARELGYGRTTVYRWLTDKRSPSVGLLDAAEAFLATHGSSNKGNKPA